MHYTLRLPIQKIQLSSILMSLTDVSVINFFHFTDITGAVYVNYYLSQIGPLRDSSEVYNINLRDIVNIETCLDCSLIKLILYQIDSMV